MRTFIKQFGVMALAGGALLGLSLPQASAQFFRQTTLPVFSPGVNPMSPFYNPIAPTFRVAPGVTSQQALFNTFQPLAAASRLPPWMFGYNPYPSPIIGSPFLPYGGVPAYGPGMYSNPYGSYPPTIIASSGGGGSNVYGSAGLVDPNNPYTSALAATNSPSSNGYSYAPYATDPYSGYLYGSAAVLGQQGKLILDQERARLLREMVHQSKLETKKKKIEFENWKKEHEWTFTKEQARNAKNTLERIRNNASVGEIESGNAMNLLLKDLAKYHGKDVGTMPIDENILKRININNGAGNLGVLRQDGQLTWPTALVDLVPEKERNDVDELAQGLYRLGLEGNLKPNLVRDLQVRVKRLQELLGNQLNDIPSSQFVEARHFLNDLQSAVTALSRPGLAPAYAAYLRFIRGGKTAKEVADYLIGNGLSVASANAGDEGAYNLLHSALAHYDIQASAAQVASSH
jgi:hypothetical protein